MSQELAPADNNLDKEPKGSALKESDIQLNESARVIKTKSLDFYLLIDLEMKTITSMKKPNLGLTFTFLIFS